MASPSSGGPHVIWYEAAFDFGQRLIRNFVIASFAAGDAVIKPILAEANVNLALAVATIFLALAALFVHLALHANDFGLFG
jgi:hypothetical protein